LTRGLGKVFEKLRHEWGVKKSQQQKKGEGNEILHHQLKIRVGHQGNPGDVRRGKISKKKKGRAPGLRCLFVAGKNDQQ